MRIALGCGRRRLISPISTRESRVHWDHRDVTMPLQHQRPEVGQLWSKADLGDQYGPGAVLYNAQTMAQVQ